MWKILVVSAVLIAAVALLYFVFRRAPLFSLGDVIEEEEDKKPRRNSSGHEE